MKLAGRWVLACAWLMPMLASPPPPAAAARAQHTLQVFAAASLADAFSELGRLLEAGHPGLEVRFNFAGSQQLATQLGEGAAADVFASADERWMEAVREQGLLASEPVIFARNELVVIVPRRNPGHIASLADLARRGVKLVLAAETVPAGRYARAALAKLSREPALGPEFATRVLRNTVSEEENVKAVVGKVQLGEADAGIVYRSDVSPAVARVVTRIPIPPDANVVALYPIALLRGGHAGAAARAFVELALSPRGQQVLEQRGLMRAATGR